MRPGQPTPGVPIQFYSQDREDEWALNNLFWGMIGGSYIVS